MRVLVAYASRHGGTAGIAEALAATLRDAVPHDAGADRDRHVDLVAAGEVDDVTGYDAVVVGSAVYLGHWLGPARRLVREQAAALQHRPVWLFSSGPVGDPAVPDTEAEEVAELTEAVAALAHRTFAGRLRPADLGLVERATVRAVHAAEGDYRDWDAIRDWAEEIADTLAAAVAP